MQKKRKVEGSVMGVMGGRGVGVGRGGGGWLVAMLGVGGDVGYRDVNQE